MIDSSFLHEMLQLQMAADFCEAMKELAISDNVKLGVRVVRGPDWKWGDQDVEEGHVGTVVKVKSAGKEVIVRWDSGRQCNYRSGVMEKCDLRIVDNRVTGMVHVGSRCSGCAEQNIKGMKWRCAVCDGVELCTKCFMGDKHNVSHTFMRYNEPASDGKPVRKREGLHKIQMKGIFAGSKVERGKDWKWKNQDRPRHKNVSCDVCDEAPIIDARWKCTICPNYDLCIDCYNGEKHSEHPFVKIAFPGATPVAGVPRDHAAAHKSQVMSMAAGEFVSVRNPPPPGEVIGEDDDQPGWVDVQWSGSNKNSYRLGAEGKVDLEYLSPTSGGFYYKETLPVLGKSEEEWVEPDEETESEALPRPTPPPQNTSGSNAMVPIHHTALAEGDQIQVNVDKDQLEKQQNESVGWNPEMAEVIGRVGQVAGCTDAVVMVVYAGCSNQHPFVHSVITKVIPAEEGHNVIISNDLEKVQNFQLQIGQWNAEMIQLLGQKGKVKYVLEENMIEVEVAGTGWILNPRVCVITTGGARARDNNAEQSTPDNGRTPRV